MDIEPINNSPQRRAGVEPLGDLAGGEPSFLIMGFPPATRLDRYTVVSSETLYNAVLEPVYGDDYYGGFVERITFGMSSYKVELEMRDYRVAMGLDLQEAIRNLNLGDS